tara:strand:- start:276 stop:557 length:282 start_codon:yes stop_codon:yes gene_type:complete
MNKLRAALANLIFAVSLLIPFQVLAESYLEPDEELFASVCRDYEVIGPSTKCENKLYKIEVPLIYGHELPFAQPIVSNAININRFFNKEVSFR